MSVRLPAEWEEQDGVLVAWPHEDSDWHPHLDIVEPVFVEIVKAISRFERTLIVSPDAGRVKRVLAAAGVTMANVRNFSLPTKDRRTSSPPGTPRSRRRSSPGRSGRRR